MAKLVSLKMLSVPLSVIWRRNMKNREDTFPYRRFYTSDLNIMNIKTIIAGDVKYSVICDTER